MAKNCFHLVPTIEFLDGWCVTCRDCDIREYMTLGDIRQLLWSLEAATKGEINA